MLDQSGTVDFIRIIWIYHGVTEIKNLPIVIYLLTCYASNSSYYSLSNST